MAFGVLVAALTSRVIHPNNFHDVFEEFRWVCSPEGAKKKLGPHIQKEFLALVSRRIFQQLCRTWPLQAKVSTPSVTQVSTHYTIDSHSCLSLYHAIAQVCPKLDACEALVAERVQDMVS